VAVLHFVRDRAAILTGLARPKGRAARILLAAWVMAASACRPTESDLPPDRRLQWELGLDPRDRVHEVILSAGPTGAAEPEETRLLQGDYLQFVTADSWVHELLFEVDSLAADARAFMSDLDQLASPPMVSRGSRFIVSFVGAPDGRYPFRVEGSHGPVRGAVVVEAPPGR
jgi:hypothetical protein